MSEIRRMGEVDTLEVSLVTKGANRKRFAVVKTEWDTAYVNDLPDSAFLYVEAGGDKDESGRTIPRSLRHFPVKDKDGQVDPAHVRNALARIPQSDAPGLDKDKVRVKAEALLEEIKKSAPQGSQEAVMDVIEAVLKTEIDGEEKLGAVMKGYSEKGAQAFKALYKIAKGFEDELPKGALKDLAKACGLDPEEVKKAEDLSKLDPESRAKVEALFKANDEKQKQLESVQKQLADLREEQRTKEFIAKAEAYKALPGIETKDLGLVLKALTDASPALLGKIEGVLKAASEAIAESALLRSSGQPGGGFSGGAWEQIQQLARGLVQKSTDGLTEAQAIDHVIYQTAAGQKLYGQYLAEHPKQSA